MYIRSSLLFTKRASSMVTSAKREGPREEKTNEASFAFPSSLARPLYISRETSGYEEALEVFVSKSFSNLYRPLT